MKKISLFTLTIIMALSSDAQKLTILHTNDMHSRLLGFAPTSEYTPFSLNDDKTRGGFARLAHLIKEKEGQNPEGTLVLDAGDFLMGTLFHTLETKKGFQLRLMKEMGYDLAAIGNHEFDFGIDKLAQIISAGQQHGEIPPLLLSNIEFNPSETKDDALMDHFSEGGIKRYLVLEKNGLKIGLFSLMGLDAADVAPFVEPARFTDRLVAAAELTNFLKEDQEVDLLICLSHSGLAKDKKGSWAGEDVELAKEVPGIDLIVSGHTHTHLFEPLVVNGTTIVSAGSEAQFLGTVDIEKQGDKWIAVKGELLLIDDKIPGDKNTQKLIDEYQEEINREVLGSMNITSGKTLVETSFDLRFNEQTMLEESNLAPMVADAIHWYINTYVPNDITLVAAGLVRDELRVGTSGKQNSNDIFRVVPLGMGVFDDSPGYSLAQIHVTGRELKSILEVMLVAPKMSSSYYPFWEGLRFKYNPRRMLFDQVYEVEIGNEKDGFQKIDLSKSNDKLYSISSNNYVLEFFGVIGDLTKGILKVVPKDANGFPIADLDTSVIDGDKSLPGYQEIKEWEAMMLFVSTFPDTNGNGIPDVPEKYRLPSNEKERNSSLNPVLLFKNTNGINAVVSLVVVGILAGAGVLIL